MVWPGVDFVTAYPTVFRGEAARPAAPSLPLGATNRAPAGTGYWAVTVELAAVARSELCAGAEPAPAGDPTMSSPMTIAAVVVNAPAQWRADGVTNVESFMSEIPSEGMQAQNHSRLRPAARFWSVEFYGRGNLRWPPRITRL